jgi:hypothetical protein
VFRKDYYSSVRKGKAPKPESAFEENYHICWNFKKRAKKYDFNTKIFELKRLADIVLTGNLISYSKRRKAKHKTARKCFCCGNKAFYQHHIILLKNGGYDNGINRIPICHECHVLIHPWMMLPNKLF